MHAAQIQMRPRPGGEGACLCYQQAELCIGAAGGNLVVGICIDGGIEAQHNLLAHTGAGCELFEALQLLGCLHIQPANAGLQRLLQLHDHGVQLRHLGHLEGVHSRLAEKIQNAIELTRNNTRIVLNFAFNYGGRDEIVRAVQHMIEDGLQSWEITPERISEYLYTAGQPDPDLIIRTSGEFRTSNFLVWQSAYSEWYFTPVFWPDFDERELRKALEFFAKRERRFGKVPEQVTTTAG